LRQFLRDSGHLIRPAIVLLVGFAVFMLIRTALIPKAFGRYGHYDAASLDRIRQHPISYAGQDACVMCHDDEAKARASGRHAHVSCEACHGPQDAHATADDPSAHKPALPDVANLCRRCHEKDAAKPPNFPQVVTVEHSGGALCTACHQPHNPHL
jgi:ABC-type nickel/cobalt efflux system permease component RcnA